MKINNGHSRRGFLKRLGSFLTILFLKPVSGSSQGILKGITGKKKIVYRGIVVLAKDPGYSRKTEKNSSGIAKKLLDGSMMKITGRDTLKEAWSIVGGKSDIVGIKLNCLAAPDLSPLCELVYSIVDGLKLAGVKENNIIIFERTERELKRAGFKINTSPAGVRCFGTDSLPNPYKSKLESSGSIGSLFSSIIADICSSIVNVGVLKDHSLCGVGAGMKNFYGVIHNPNKYHDSNCSPYIADVCNHRYVRDKLKLTVIDASTCQYDRGPGYYPDGCMDYNSILVGVDPVAVDRIAHYIIDEQRKKNGLKTLAQDKRPPVFIDYAGELGLGESDPAKINLIKI